ncbi:MAG: response regulator [Polyangiales bacterium]
MNKKTVLVVDDSPSARACIRSVLAEGGFDVVEAVDGVDGHSKISTIDDLSLVVCDINMPRMGGIAMLRLVKANPKHANLPIILLTTEGQPELIRTAKKAGAKGWMVKPFRPKLLLAAVTKLTSLDKAG